MTNLDHRIINGYERVAQARNVIQLAKGIADNIDASLIPDREINYFELDRKSTKGQFSSVFDIIYTFELPKSAPPPIWLSTWELEVHEPLNYEGFPNKGHFVTSGLLLSNLGSLIQFRLGKHQDYRTLNERSIKNPGHLESLLGKFAAKHSIDYPTL